MARADGRTTIRLDYLFVRSFQLVLRHSPSSLKRVCRNVLPALLTPKAQKLIAAQKGNPENGHYG